MEIVWAVAVANGARPKGYPFRLSINKFVRDLAEQIAHRKMLVAFHIAETNPVFNESAESNLS